MHFILNLLAELDHQDVRLLICRSVNFPRARDHSQIGFTSFSVEI